jgi:hypothetical protein
MTVVGDRVAGLAPVTGDRLFVRALRSPPALTVQPATPPAGLSR